MKNLKKIPLVLTLAFILPLNILNKTSKFPTLEKFYEQKRKHYETTINDYFKISNKIKYTRDFPVHGISDFWQFPQETDSLGTGDCEDKAIKTYKDLKEKGLEVKLCWGKFDTSHHNSHFWNEYSIGNDSYIIETSSKGKILDRKEINNEAKYKLTRFNFHHRNMVKEFEYNSGIDLEFKNEQSSNH